MSFKKTFLFLLVIITTLLLTSCVKDDGKGKINKISIDQDNMSESYDIDNFVLSDIKLFLIDSEWNSKIIDLEESMISSDDLELLKSPGDYEIRVSHLKLETTFNIKMRFKEQKQDLYDIYKLVTGSFELNDFINWYLDISNNDVLIINNSYIDIWGHLILDLDSGEEIDKGLLLNPIDRDYEFRVNGNYIEWKYSLEEYWIILVHKDTLEIMFGEDIVLDNVEFKANNDNLEISYNDGSYITVANLSTLLSDGEIKAYVEEGLWYVGLYNTKKLYQEEQVNRVSTSGLNYTLTTINGVEGYELTTYAGEDLDIVLDNTYNSKPVISIKNGSLPLSIKSLSISSNTIILPSFSDYDSLERFDFNNALIDTISDEMFLNCISLRTVTNYDNIKNIGVKAFYNTKVLPSQFVYTNIKTIGDEAFHMLNGYELNLRVLFEICEDRYDMVGEQFVYLPDTIDSVGIKAFPANFPVYYEGSKDILSTHVGLYKNIKEHNGLWYVEKEDELNNKYISIVNYIGELAHLIVPKEINSIPVLEIEEYAFNGNVYLERIDLPDSIKKIGTYSFSITSKLYIVGVTSKVEFTSIYGKYYIGISLEDIINYYDDLPIEKYKKSVEEGSSVVFVLKHKYSETFDFSRYFDNEDINSFYQNDQFVYRVFNNKVRIVAIKNQEGVVLIPKMIDGMEVISIASNAVVGFNGGLTGVDIQDGILRIGYLAFNINSKDVSLLEFINVPSTIRDLPAYFVSSTLGINIHIDLPSDNINVSTFRSYSQEEGYLNNVVWNARYTYK